MKWKLYILWLSYLDTFTETSTVPDQAVDLGEQGLSTISEAVCYPDVTTAQQHIVGDVMCPSEENGKKSSRKPRISESVQALLYCFPCTDFHSSMYYYSTTPLRNAVNVPAFDTSR